MTQKSIGRYQIIHSLGQGGMGEVFLAWDPICGRHVALKRIRSEMTTHTNLRQRFLQEARIASQLTHPSIIPIYTINEACGEIFYTMPYAEGETLKQILKVSRSQQQEGEIRHPIGTSLPALMRIFLSICQAIAYSHSKDILHKDLKPDNIIIGKYGEALIIDWGLANIISSTNSSPPVKEKKIPGTLAYLAPERLKGAPASFATDIYALGVILYQLLTLQLPFHRVSLQKWRKTYAQEIFQAPQKIAPYRDIPQHLSDVAKKALDPDPTARFQTLGEIISEIQSYIEGRPEWLPAAQLNLDRSSDWEFQENILLTKHLAITRTPSVMEWVSLMISHQSFSGNTRIRAKIRLKSEGNGIGFLLNIPEKSERKGLEEGYCLWIGSEGKPGCKLFRSNVEVLHLPMLFLKPNQWHDVYLENTDNHLRFYLDHSLQFQYVSYIPVIGTHVGILYRDADFEMSQYHIDTSSQNIMVHCLAIPDAFLANKLYSKALSEYRRIGYSFPGRAEGREALFRAGITLLEEARSKKKKKDREKFYALAHEEFGKLRHTPGAPLEYLGKALVYQSMGELEEEVKCLELCVRKYPKHPLLKVVGEHITLRLHETALFHRLAAYQFALLSIRHLPQIFDSEDSCHLLGHLIQHLEPLPFFFPILEDLHHLSLAIQLSFWLAKPLTLIELIENGLPPPLHYNALYALLYLGERKWVKAYLAKTPAVDQIENQCIACLLAAHEKGPHQSFLALLHLTQSAETAPSLLRAAHYLLRRMDTLPPSVLQALNTLLQLPSECKALRLSIDAECIRLHLCQEEWEAAEAILDRHSLKELIDPQNPLYAMAGCLLWKTGGSSAALSHFSDMAETPYPPTTALLGAFLHGKIKPFRHKHKQTTSNRPGWENQAFFWEKRELARQLDQKGLKK